MGFGRFRRLCVTIVVATFASGLAHGAELMVSAASSLDNAFRDIAARYEAEHSGTRVLLNFGASGALLQQIDKGAPVDVFASADQATMDLAEQRKLVAGPDRRVFAHNTLVLIVPRGGRHAIAQMADLQRADLRKIAIGNAASVPAGRYARRALELAGLWPTIDSKAIPAQNVRQVLDYVARGEVDAGFVYATDAAIMPDAVEVVFEVPLDTRISYPIAVTSDSTNAAEARRFVAYVISPEAQAILRGHGFQGP